MSSQGDVLPAAIAIKGINGMLLEAACQSVCRNLCGVLG
jgi:hypothetical protein